MKFAEPGRNGCFAAICTVLVTALVSQAEVAPASVETHRVHGVHSAHGARQAPQVGAPEVGALQVRAPEVGAPEVGALEVGDQEAAPQEASAAAPRKSENPEPERGYAAFYSSSLEGHKTACGGVYSASKLTAAHKRLPCGTKLRVTNLRNGKTVRVTVTDHGPFSNGRILDLSYAAAVHLDFIKQGTTLVKVEVIR
jgi:rare lipoprotein A